MWRLLNRRLSRLAGMLLRNGRGYASARAILKNAHRREQDAEHNQRCDRRLEPAHENQGSAEPQVLLEARGAANNVRERKVCQAEPPISIRHGS
ncbi:MAG: hypothetical protein DMG57_04640 [Acidobacteria bacterium]|nr:MAG: hypothetical protein DMG57_04640 [Acidobacteriota bacterium]